MAEIIKEEILRFAKPVVPWRAGLEVENGNLITAVLGENGTTAVLLVMVDRTTGAKLDAEELGPDGNNTGNSFNLIAQQDLIQWAPGLLTLIGLRMKLNGFMGESYSVRETGAEFDFQELIQFNPVATAATGIGRIYFQPDHGFVVGQWVTNIGDGYVLAQPDDPALRETEGRISLIPTPDSFIVESDGYGCDPLNSDTDEFWDYDPGTELILAKDGGVTDNKPSDKPYRSLGLVTEPGYFKTNQRTVYPNNYKPVLVEWPSDPMLRAAVGADGFLAFLFAGADPAHDPGWYINPNAGKDGAISAPTRI